MADFQRHVIHGIVVDTDMMFTLAELCRASGSETTHVIALIEEGVLEPVGDGPQDWRFDGASLATVRTALRLMRDFEVGMAGAAIVLDLLNQIELLRSRLLRAGLA